MCAHSSRTCLGVVSHKAVGVEKGRKEDEDGGFSSPCTGLHVAFGRPLFLSQSMLDRWVLLTGEGSLDMGFRS